MNRVVSEIIAKRTGPGEMATAVVASTDLIVSSALSSDWLLMLDQCDQRRELLSRLELTSSREYSASSIAALQAAVSESEKAVARIVAHAMICKQAGSENMFASRN